MYGWVMMGIIKVFMVLGVVCFKLLELFFN